jgi:hypothetical protein
MLGKNISYLKSTTGSKTTDYILTNEDIILEIGGKDKGRRHFKGMKSARKIILADSYQHNTAGKNHSLL